MTVQRNDRLSSVVREVLTEGGVAIETPVITSPDIDGGTIDGVDVTGELLDSTTYIVDDADQTKRLKFELSGVTTGTDRTLTVPNANDTLVGRATTDTLTNKTLTAPVMTTPTLGVATATSVNKVAITAPATGATLVIPDGVTLTGPAASGTAATLAGSETLTNKTLTAPVMTTPTLGVAVATSINKVAFTAPATGSTLVVPDGAAITLPTGTRTLASLDGPETLSNKTLGAGTVMSTTVATGVQAKGAALAAAGSVSSLTVVKTALADAVATDAFTITVPNAIHGGAIFIRAAGMLSDGDSVKGKDYVIPISRIAGANLKTGAGGPVAGTLDSGTTGATADADVEILRGSIVGAAGATQTFTVQVKVSRSAGASTNHTAVLELTLLNCNASGISLAAA